MATLPDRPLLKAKDAAKVLGVSMTHIYSLAAPKGPIPCYRIGRSVNFDMRDLTAYLESCRCDPLPKLDLKVSLRSSPRIKVTDPAGESELEKYFRKMGLKPRRKR